ncbi:C-C motif chemokine 27b isoform X2 [Labeo rohita]|uniref:C-C motif chemokine 27b isoform X2 n=1 Tax=Labeo rohita TaxID=84645 RepID=UPI0021E34601|nr:C-C motif chemokine 27b isoform X2 [Labeo rohita]
MEMKLIVVGILLFVTFSAVQGVTPKCCVQTTPKFTKEMLNKVTKYERQTNHGVCAINALVLHTNEKRYCLMPTLEPYLKVHLRRHRRHGLKNA